MKSSEEMTRSVMDKIRTAQAERARRNKMIAGIAAVVTPLVIVTAVFGAVNLRSGSMKKAADSAQANEAFPENADYYAGEENIAEDFYDREAYKSSGKSAKSADADADEADGAVTLTYEELCGILPDGNLLKNLEENGFTVSDCPAKLKDGAESRNYSDFVSLGAGFIKGKAEGTLECLCYYTGSAESYVMTRSSGSGDKNRAEFETGNTRVIYFDWGDTYNAVFEKDGELYEINARGISSPGEFEEIVSEIIG
jgi:hypothetical protein